MQIESIWKYLPKQKITRGCFILCALLLLGLGLKILNQLKPGKFEDLLPDGNQVKNSYQLYQKEFNVQDKIYLLLIKKENQFTAEEIRQENLFWKSELRHYPEIVKIETLSDRKVVAIHGDEFIVRKTDEESRRSFAFWENIHLGKDKNSLLITISLKKLNNQEQNALIKKLLGRPENPHYQTYWVGSLVSNYFFFQEQIKLQYILCPLILLIMSVFLSFLFRTIKVGLAFAANIIVIYFILGMIIGYVENGISPYSSFALFFTLIISTSDLIHLFYSWTLGESEQDKKNRKQVFKRCFYTSVTTVIAFFTFIFNSNVSIQELGKYSGLGGIIAFVITFYAFPFTLGLWTKHKRLFLQKRVVQDFLPAEISGKANGFLYLIAVFCLFCIPQVIIDEDPYHKFSTDHYLNQGINYLKKDFGFVGPLDLTLEFPANDLNQKTLEELDSIEKKLMSVPGVTNVKSLSSLFAQTFYRDEKSEETIPFTQMKNFSRILTNFQLIDYYYNPTIKKMRIEIFVNTTSSRELTQINDEIKKIMTELKLTNFSKQELVGFPQVMLSLYEHFKTDFFFSLASSLIFIFLCFVFMLKSFKKSLIAMIPNLFPLVVSAGIIGLLSHFFHFALESNLLVINCVVLGIAVDDSIHFLLELEEQLKHHSDFPQALKVAKEQVGDSLKATTYVLLTAFVSFLFSDIVLFAQMGLLIAFSLWLALVADLWMMPHLILKFRRFWQK